MSIDIKYRFPGLSSYSKDDASIFKGRDDDSLKLYTKVTLYKTIVLHADSGTGKSSLIQAGLLPLIEKSEEKYVPVIIEMDEIVSAVGERLLVDYTISKIELEYPNISSNNLTLLENTSNSLWKISKQFESEGKILLLIFDQFEHLQNFKPDQIKYFKTELFDLLNSKIPQNLYKSIEKRLSTAINTKTEEYKKINQEYDFLSNPNVAKALFVIREDKLGVMCLLSDRFPNILKNDCRIEPFTKEAAHSALIEPANAEGLFFSTPFSFNDPDFLINKIADEETDLVDPILLQIVASNLERNLVIPKNKDIVNNDDIPEVPNILIEYYNACLDKIKEDLNLTELQISEYKKTILTHFVINERRTLVDSGSIETDVGSKEFIKKLVDIGLIRKIPAERNTCYFQLVHDRLIVPIVNDPKIINTNYFEKYSKSIKLANKITIISIVILMLSWFYVEINYFFYNKSQENRIKIQQIINKKFDTSLNEYIKLDDSILVIYNLIDNINKKSQNELSDKSEIKTKLDSLNKKLSNLYSDQQKIKNNYSKTIDKNGILISYDKYSAKGLTPSIIIILNILLWCLLVFLQFARRISLKHLFKEIQVYKTKQPSIINQYNDFKLYLPLWLSPVTGTNHKLFGSIEPTNIFNRSFKPNFLNFILVLCFLIVVSIQFRLTYLSYIFSDVNLNLNFYLSGLFSIFSIVIVTFWFSRLNFEEYSNYKENSKTLSRYDFITISTYSVLSIALFKLSPILSEHFKEIFKRKPRYRVKNLKFKFELSDYKSSIVKNKKSNIIHFINDKGFSLALRTIQTYQDFGLFKHNIEIFNQLDELETKNKPRLSIKDSSWNAENIALDYVRSGNIEKSVKILLYGIKQKLENNHSSPRLNDLLALICIRQAKKVPNDTWAKLIEMSVASEDQKLIIRVEKWKDQTWRNKIIKKQNVIFNKTEI